jgi:hypothetical protein
MRPTKFLSDSTPIALQSKSLQVVASPCWPPAPLPARRAYRPEGRAYGSERKWPFPTLSLQSLRRCLDPHPAIIPEVEGTAHITGRHEFLIDPTDPLQDGFVLR